uniref:Phosphatidylinositol N-acetylglucosaminyltransferase subunit H conserved domain-containing protein n=1 Tax=Chloropicon laureae TaxID=464258 RepID=A0A7S2Z9L9_9CHLO|mmetsp:Transcript_9773/g.25113  ORF Transcript_9773/g.25113 Transcript_9773/m.25113 type:complete len:108 (+) Transcript_9773:78-401(+)
MPILLGLCLLHACRATKYERVTLFKGIGAQIESGGLLMQTSKTFFERNEIAAVLINEAVTAVDVYYYLCFVIKGSEELAIGFPTSRPSANFLAQVYKEAKRFFPPTF